MTQRGWSIILNSVFSLFCGAAICVTLLLTSEWQFAVVEATLWAWATFNDLEE